MKKRIWGYNEASIGQLVLALHYSFTSRPLSHTHMHMHTHKHTAHHFNKNLWLLAIITKVFLKDPCRRKKIAVNNKKLFAQIWLLAEKPVINRVFRCASHLYKRVCPSVGPLVRPLVRPSVGPSVRWSVGHTFVKKSKKVFVFVKCLKVENGHVGASVVPVGTCYESVTDGPTDGPTDTPSYRVLTDGPTDGWMDIPSYRVAWMRLKTAFF